MLLVRLSEQHNRCTLPLWVCVCGASAPQRTHFFFTEKTTIFFSARRKGGAEERLRFREEKSLLALELVLQNQVRVVNNTSVLNESENCRAAWMFISLWDQMGSIPG